MSDALQKSSHYILSKIVCGKDHMAIYLLSSLPNTFPKVLGRLGLLLVSEGLGPQILFNSKIAG